MKNKRCFKENIRLKKKIEKIIPYGSSTIAKTPNRLLEGYSPFYAVSADGSHFIDVDGNDWIDCEMAMGTIVWGHNRKEINEAIIEQLKKGVNHSVPSILEYELANRLLDRYTKYEAVKYFKNGADAVYAGVRVARKITGKEKSLTCSSYHGWLDWSNFGYYKCKPENIGIIADMQKYNYCCNNYNEIIFTLKEKNKKIACAVICPQAFSKEELENIINVCHDFSIITIFDEVTSGIRYAYCGVAGAYNIYPDIICISKGMANGLPLAATLGKRELILPMSDLKISNAHAGEALALASAIACEDLLNSVKIWPTWKQVANQIINHVSIELKQILNECNLTIDGVAGCFSVHTVNTLFWDDPFRKYLMKFFSNRGIFTKGYIIFSDAHMDEEINYVGNSLCECIIKYAEDFNSL